jgi:hypothetical protein
VDVGGGRMTMIKRMGGGVWEEVRAEGRDE